MAHVGQELALGSAGRLGPGQGIVQLEVLDLHGLSKFIQLLLHPLALGDVARRIEHVRDAIELNRHTADFHVKQRAVLPLMNSGEFHTRLPRIVPANNRNQILLGDSAVPLGDIHTD